MSTPSTVVAEIVDEYTAGRSIRIAISSDLEMVAVSASLDADEARDLADELDGLADQIESQRDAQLGRDPDEYRDNRIEEGMGR